MKLRKFLLPLILFVAFIIRGYQINTLPSLNPDEAALGYNAYSLLQTGLDEHGHSWPLHFQSFGDYKPGGYVYLDMPFIYFLGLNPLSVRLPNLILSVFTIFIVYQLIFLLSQSTTLALLSAGVLALNPWHIHFSRGAWESSVALFFLTLGVYWLYKFITSSASKYLFLFPLPLVASLYVYHSARIVVPILILVIVVKYFSFFTRKLWLSLLSLFVAILFTVPVLSSFLRNGGTARFGGVGLTADYGPTARAEELLNQHGSVDLLYRIIHNKRLLYGLSWAEKYASHFNLNFLFLTGDEVPRSQSPDMGQAYLFELPLFILGIVYFFQKKKLSNLTFLLVVWLLVGPLASSLTFQAPSALRALPMAVPLSVLVAAGLTYLLSLRKLLLNFILVCFYLYSLAYYYDAYFIRSPQKYSFSWNSGFSQIVPYVDSQKQNYKNVFFTDKYDQPYILYLFFSQYPPVKFQSQSQLTPPDIYGFSTVLKIDNITFHIPETIPENSLVIDSADYENTGQSFKIYTK